MKEHDDHTGSANIETLRYLHQYAAVIVGLVLPVNSAAICAVAATPILVDVQEWLAADRIVAEIGKCGIFHAHRRGLIFSSWRLARHRRSEPARLVGLSARACRAPTADADWFARSDVSNCALTIHPLPHVHRRPAYVSSFQLR